VSYIVVTLVGGPGDGMELRVIDGVWLVEVPAVGGIGQYERAMDGRFYWAGVRKRRLL
jgi:hypothetical protein